jgi:peptidoglycan/xylan/chitin deacetylase (PgdA/CDA1 family)
MSAWMRNIIAATGWRLRPRQFWLPPESVVLMYHGIPRSRNPWGLNADSFTRQILFLKQNFEIVQPGRGAEPRAQRERIQVALTFDDGFRNNAEIVAPILREHGVPALFFVSTRHCEPGRYLWTAYLRALEDCYRGDSLPFRGDTIDVSPARRAESVRRLRAFLLTLRPHPTAIYQAIETELPQLEDFVPPEEIVDRYAGMTPEQLKSLAADPLFTIGGHTEDHPLLTKCAPQEARRQILANKKWIEDLSNRECRFFAYPQSDFDQFAIEECRRAGFTQAYSAERRAQCEARFDHPRIGVYYPSLDQLGFKVRWSHCLAGRQIPRLGRWRRAQKVAAASLLSDPR